MQIYTVDIYLILRIMSMVLCALAVVLGIANAGGDGDYELTVIMYLAFFVVNGIAFVMLCGQTSHIDEWVERFQYANGFKDANDAFCKYFWGHVRYTIYVVVSMVTMGLAG